MGHAELLCVTNAWPPMASGVGRYSEALFSNLVSAIILAPRVCGHHNLPPNVRPVFRFGGRHGGPFRFRSVAQNIEIVLRPIWCILRLEKWPKIVVCTQPLFSGVAGLVCNRLFRIPYIIIGHGEEFRGALSRHTLFNWRRKLIQQVLKRASAIICNSENTRRILFDSYNVSAGRLHVIHPGVNTTAMLEDLRRIGADAMQLRDKRIILMIGRLDQKHKGFDKAIESLPIILERIPNAHLRIIGPGQQGHLLDLARRWHMSAHVSLLGELRRSELLRHLACCDVFLLPGRSLPDSEEGFGIVYLEAALFKKPVVAGKFGGAAEAVISGHTGILVDGDDSAEIAKAVTTLLEDALLAKQLGQNGYDRVLKEFTLEAVSRKFRALLGSLYIASV